MTAPRYGITVLAHVQHSLDQAVADLTLVNAAVHHGRRLLPKERDELRRTLAGVISACEAFRTSAAGIPWHPLYLPYTSPLEPLRVKG